MDALEICARAQALYNSRRNVEDQWRDITTLVVPYRNDFDEGKITEEAVTWRENRNTYDSSAIMAAQSLAASLHGSLSSPAIKWFDLAFRNRDNNTDQAATIWLENAATMVYSTLQESNFNLEMNEAYLDLVTYGTCCLFEEAAEEREGLFQGVDFSAFPLKEILFEENSRGQIMNMYRQKMMTALQMIDLFGQEGVPQKYRDEAANPKTGEKQHEVIFAIFERRDKARDDGTVRPPLERRFGFRWVIKADKETLGEEGGYYSMPVYLPRWRKTSGSKWGNSPAMWALPDIKTLNHMVEMGLDGLARAIDPTVMATENALRGELNLGAGEVNVVNDIEGIKTFDTGTDFMVEFTKEDQLRSSIRTIFFTDQLQLKESPQMTAYEVRIRYQLMQQLLGPTLGRLQTELLDPLIIRTFFILLRAGELGEMPESLTDGGGAMNIEYVGPLAQSQKADQVAIIDEWVTGVLAQAELRPDVLDVVDWDAVQRLRAERLGVPSEIVLGEADVDEIRDERAQQMAAQREVELAQQAGAAMQDVAAGTQQLEQAGVG